MRIFAGLLLLACGCGQTPVSELAKALSDEDNSVRYKAAKKLEDYGPAAFEAVDELADALSDPDKKRVETEAKISGKDPKFMGFDGNNEAEHLGVARFLIDYLGRFSSFGGRDLNSHMPSIDGDRRMLSVFKPMRRSLSGGQLGATSIIELLDELVHPDNR